MNISRINPYNILSFKALRKEPTSYGYAVYDNDILKENVAVDMTRGGLISKDTFDRSGNVVTSKQIVYPQGCIEEATYEYSKDNKLTKEVIKDGDGKVKVERTLKYHPNGNIRLIKADNYARNEHILFLHDDKGRRTVMTCNKNGKNEYTRYDYNQNGDLETSITTDENGNQINLTFYEYYNKGKMKMASIYDKNDFLICQSSYSPKNGELERSLVQGENGVRCADEFFYDANGEKLMFHTLNDEFGEISMTRYFYSDDGKLLEEKTFLDNKEIISVKYNPKNGKVESKTEYTEDGKILTKDAFKFDEYGRCNLDLRYIGYLKKPYALGFDYENKAFFEFNIKTEE